MVSVYIDYIQYFFLVKRELKKDLCFSEAFIVHVEKRAMDTELFDLNPWLFFM